SARWWAAPLLRLSLEGWPTRWALPSFSRLRRLQSASRSWSSVSAYANPNADESIATRGEGSPRRLQRKAPQGSITGRTEVREPKPVDVAIVGYGPTGQLLALLLGRKGHSVVVVDRWPDLYPLPRAVHFDDEIARILKAAGAMDQVQAITEVVDSYQWRNAAGDILIEFSSSARGRSGWPAANMFAQPELERILDAKVKAEPTVTVRQGWSASSLSQDASGVHVGIEHGTMRDGEWVADGERDTLHARYVVGADGANSFV